MFMINHAPATTFSTRTESELLRVALNLILLTWTDPTRCYPQKDSSTSFLDLREFAGFCGSLRVFCGSFAGSSQRFFLDYDCFFNYKRYDGSRFLKSQLKTIF